VLAALLSQPIVFGCSWAELIGVFLGLPTIVGAVLALRKYLQCQHPQCRSLGLHPLGHLRLCGLHHPRVPDGGVTVEHIAETGDRLGR